MAVDAQIAVAEIVRVDENDVGWRIEGALGCDCESRGEQAEGRAQDRSRRRQAYISNERGMTA